MGRIVDVALVLVILAFLVLLAFYGINEALSLWDWTECIANGGWVEVTREDGRDRSWCDYGEEGRPVAWGELWDGTPYVTGSIYLVPIGNPTWLHDPGPAGYYGCGPYEGHEPCE